jgi:hypothetical protein
MNWSDVQPIAGLPEALARDFADGGKVPGNGRILEEAVTRTTLAAFNTCDRAKHRLLIPVEPLVGYSRVHG